jgi:hypothetical protein
MTVSRTLWLCKDLLSVVGVCLLIYRTIEARVEREAGRKSRCRKNGPEIQQDEALFLFNKIKP